MTDWLSILADGSALAVAGVAGGGVQWLFQAWRDNRNDKQGMEQVTDRLAIDLLEQARQEVSILRTEVAGHKVTVDRYQELERRLFHFDEALRHIEELLDATPENRAFYERSARAFLKRMKQTSSQTAATSPDGQ